MNAIEPKNAREKQLVKKEDWEKAKEIEQYWQENKVNCDLCRNPITSRHMIDGKLHGTEYEFACMCAACHQSRGSGFGEGKGQLYTRLTNGKFIQTFGFTSDQQENKEDIWW